MHVAFKPQKGQTEYGLEISNRHCRNYKMGIKKEPKCTDWFEIIDFEAKSVPRIPSLTFSTKNLVQFVLAQKIILE